ncbi:Intraflagellar transport protein 172-like protein [Harpegnathos saltator]|uniref:Intraflagellar transport protein 172-like protein n=1 Tax=Harpegnathos saltator TaxID=610380 RepID=E2BS36_HARSA|nr:Intraflagellar transport protein 172-like protein [Harpegnathos saltator]
MLLKYLGTVMSAQELENKVISIAWSPNNLKLAVASSDRSIYLFDENGVKRDRFSTKPVDPKFGKKSYVVKGIAFSPESTKIAVGQTDCIVYVYKIGEDWGDKKVICNKFRQSAAVTCLIWPTEGPIIIGLADGKVRAALVKSQKAQTLYTSDAMTIALASKRTVVRGSHEVAYVGPSQVVIRPLNDSSHRSIVVRSQTGLEIDDVRILGRTDNNVVARTARTLLIGDIELGLISEIPWEDRPNGSEKFFFEYPVVCLIFCSGELTIVEYGQNEALGSVRTEAVNPHVVSVRVNERPSAGAGDNKKLAYLLDPKTVRVIDLLSGGTISMIVHDARIDWLELSEAGHRLLSRDKKSRLWLSDDAGGRVLLATSVSFASWVPSSDVVVAQTTQTLAVWYNVDASEAATLTPIKGDVVDVVREDGRTSVMVEEHGVKVAYQLDEGLIEFGTALHDNDFGRVVLFLENMGDSPQVETMWENVARNAMNERKIMIAARCYAAMGDVACAKFLKGIVEGVLKTAEAIYLEQNELDKALDMYQRYWHWEDALNLAQSRNWSGLSELRDRHLAWLLDSGQAARAASIIETTNPRRAVRLYLEARRPGRAARLVLADNELLEDERIVEDVISGLKATDLMELAGELLEKTSAGAEAIDCYAQAGVFARALDLARKVDPTLVVGLERDWGKHLAAGGHYDAAINHFIEAGETVLALQAAINARQWRKALQIIQVIEDDDPEIRQQCEKLGEYFSSIGERSLAEGLFIRADNPRRAVETHVQAGDWIRAHQVAQEYMKSDEANEVLARHAENLQQIGELRHAEALYIAIGDHDAAIAMYRKTGQRGDMIRLVAEHRPDLLQTTHTHLARELDAAGKPREAEEHFLGAGDWRGAVAAYRSANMWEDALRVAKKASGEKAAQQVALMWARTLAPELGARLLMRLNYLEPCLQLACEANLFEWALEIAKYGTADQKKEVHYRYAMALEDEGRFTEAEKEFVLAGKAMEAVQMYIHNRDWESAEDVARSHSQDAVAQVLIARAAEAAEGQDYASAEALLLRAHKPEMIIEHYKTAGMWSEALRVCREYLPSQEAALRRELGQKSAGLDGANALEEARKWLELGEVRPALDTLILNPQAPRSYLIRAADILLHQADPETATEVGRDLGARLFSVGEHALAAQVFLQADRLKDAVSSLVAVGEWERARRIVRELAPDLEPYLEEKYHDAMANESQMERLAEVDDNAALEMMARKGQWSQLFEAASLQSPEVLHRFVARRAAQLLKSDSASQALQLYAQYGAPAISQNLNLYLQLAESVLNAAQQEYRYLAQLRDILHSLCRPSPPNERFERLLEAAHFSAVRHGCRLFPALSGFVVKGSISLLRHTDILHADRCYYEAGTAARDAGLLSEAFIFFNHFLDLEECIEEEGDSNVLDVDDLRVTDFPLEVPLPEHIGVAQDQREEAREWVLAVSMDQKIEQGLPIDQRGVYVGSLTSPTNTGMTLQQCVITGYPVCGPVTKFEESNRVADRDDWTKLVNTARQAPTDSPLNDILVFLQEWCGTAPKYSF